ncbi:PD-(D/E)XK nuclease family protein [Sphingomonas morindae]|uniref:PD-(D/E)XK nuclease family protein n=1 Tax=Sphingomonas morindae TaxID=1541170 RepID=A0ABY4X729_9SPHN|nr:PD-(D/E)XK nuclease family protein [Sphingomonas morindae]USI72660.1 PD-(D/E)XK nuclease family protein [Sphingomonas morindae]
MAEAGPAVFSIPAHQPFADALAAGLMARTRGDRLALARTLLLIPSNRAGRALTDAFVRRAEAGLVLPRLVAIGDPELDEALGQALDPADAAPVPPAIAPMRRRMILARLIAEERARAGEPVDAAEAMRLSCAFARALDQMAIEEVAPEALTSLAVAGDVSAHWQSALGVMAAVLARWRALLADLGRLDPADRRNRLLDRAAARWRDAPPSHPVIAAGITSAAPAVARLLRQVARLPAGAVVLPALDLALPEAEWEALGPAAGARPIESHPQFALKLLLDRMGVARGEVRRWRHGAAPAAPAVRGRAVAHAMAPAAFTGKWQTLPKAERRLSGVTALECASPAKEAQAIAVALREAIEQPGATAALVTPDRGLARRVSAHLSRWGIEADDSAGRPLSATPPGTLLLAMAEAAAAQFAPVPLLTLLKHPLVTGGPEGTRIAWLSQVRRLDLALRGPRPAPGLDALAPLAPPAWFADLRDRLRPLETAFAAPLTIAGALAALRETGEALAGEALWANPAGRAAARLFEAMEEAAPEGPATLTPSALAPLLTRLMEEEAVRPPQGGHPRLFIWGLLESRLQQADLVVLGGLNEGVWPALPSPDPWLAPRIRAELGLPGLERRIGLSAHDFVSALGAPRAIVTRARRDARAPTVASRFWLRLGAMTGGVTPARRYRHWAAALDRPARFAPADRPAPAPPASLRPRQLAVTALDRLKADPYAFYARTMLRLRPLDPVDAEPSPAWRGTAVHAVLEQWARLDGADPARLLPRAEAMLGGIAAHPVLRALWAPRLREAVAWIAATMARLAGEGRSIIAIEQAGALDIAGVRLHGKVDRIDRDADGQLVIVDYKTGAPPRPRAVAEGYALQLGLLGLIAERGGFADVSGVAGQFEYWSLAQKDGQLGYVAPALGRRSVLDPAAFTERALQDFRAAAAQWLTGDAPFTAKIRPEYSPYDEYDALMRLDEWYGRQGADAGDGA